MPTFYNQATLSYNDVVTNSNVVQGELVAALTVTKTAVVDVYRPNDVVTYVVSIINSGMAAQTGLTVTDNLGAYSFNGATLTPLTYVEDSIKYFSNGALQAAPVVMAGPPLRVTGITVPAGGNVMLIYSVTVNQYAPLGEGSTITNTVTVTGGGICPGLTAQETITMADGPLLTITKAINPSTVVENGRLTYTFTIQNTGNEPAVATDNVVLTDLFDPILSDLVVTFNGVNWTAPANYTYNQATGLFTTVPGQITVPAATYSQDPVTGIWSIVPGIGVLTVTGTV